MMMATVEVEDSTTPSVPATADRSQMSLEEGWNLIQTHGLDQLEAIVQQQHGEMDNAFEQATLIYEFPPASAARVQSIVRSLCQTSDNTWELYMRLGQAVENHLTKVWVPRMKQQKDGNTNSSTDSPVLHWSFEYHLQEYQLLMFYAQTLQQLFQVMDDAIAKQGTKVPTTLPIVLQFGHSLLFQPYWKDLLTQTVLEFVEWDRRQDDMTESNATDVTDNSMGVRKVQRRRDWMKQIVAIFVQLDTIPKSKQNQSTPILDVTAANETYLQTLQNTVADTTLDFYRSKRDTEWRRLSYEEYQQKAQRALDAEERRGADYLEQLWIADDDDTDEKNAEAGDSMVEKSNNTSEDKLSWTIFCPTTGWFEVRSALHTMLIKQAPVDPHNPFKGGKVACVTACTLPNTSWWKKLAPKNKRKHKLKKPSTIPPATPVTKAFSWKSARSENELQPSGSSDRTVVTAASPMLSSPPSYPTDDQASISSPSACIVEAGSWVSQSQSLETQESLKEETPTPMEHKPEIAKDSEEERKVEITALKESENKSFAVLSEPEVDQVPAAQSEDDELSHKSDTLESTNDAIPLTPKSTKALSEKQMEDEKLQASPYEVEEDYELGEISYSIDPSDDPFHDVKPKEEPARQEHIGTFKVNSSFDNDEDEDFPISSGGLDEADEWSIPAVETPSNDYDFDEWSQHSGVASYNSQNDDWAKESEQHESYAEIEQAASEATSMDNRQEEDSVASFVTTDEETKMEEEKPETTPTEDTIETEAQTQLSEVESDTSSPKEVMNTSVVIAYQPQDSTDTNEVNIMDTAPPLPSPEDGLAFAPEPVVAMEDEQVTNDTVPVESNTPPAVIEETAAKVIEEAKDDEDKSNQETLVTADRVEFAKDQGVVASIHSQSLFCL